MKIKPCPFCGEKAVRNEDDFIIYIECNNCPARGEWFYLDNDNAEEFALKSWDKRVFDKEHILNYIDLEINDLTSCGPLSPLEQMRLDTLKEVREEILKNG